MAPNYPSTAEDWRDRLEREGGAEAYLDEGRDTKPRLIALPAPAEKAAYWRDLARSEPVQIELPMPEPEPVQPQEFTESPSETTIAPSIPPRVGSTKEFDLPTLKEDSVEYQSLLKRVRIKSTLGKILVAAGTAAALAAVACVGGYFLAKKKGEEYAERALAERHVKTGVTIVTNDRDLKGKPVGMVYGTAADPEDVYPDTLNGNDRSIPVPPEALVHSGGLYYWYQGLMLLEDKGHEGGMSDKIGFDPMGIARMPLSGFTQGGSNIANQTCGALGANMPYYESFAIADRKGPKAKAVHDYACGIGLATSMDPNEIAALYATYGYMGKRAQGAELFVRLYWDIDNASHQDVKVGHQLIMASAIKYPWNSKVIFPREPLAGQDDPNVFESPATTATRIVKDAGELGRLISVYEFDDDDVNYENADRILEELYRSDNSRLQKILTDDRHYEELSRRSNDEAKVYLARKFSVYKQVLKSIDSDDDLWNSISNRSHLAALRLVHDNPTTYKNLLKDLEIPEDPENLDALYMELLELSEGPYAEILGETSLHDFLFTKEITDLAQTDPIAAKVKICRKYLVLKELHEQIANNRPMSTYQATQHNPGFGLQPTPGYDYPRQLALEQAYKIFGPEWRTKVRSIVLTVDPNVQYAAVQHAQAKLDDLPPEARATVFVTDETGRIIAAYSGDKTGYDGVDRAHWDRQPASMGKLLLAHAVADRGYSPDSRKLRTFRHHLRWSNAKIQNDARLLGARPDYIRGLIDCYGRPLPGRGNDIYNDATLGVFATNPADYSRIMLDPYQDAPTPDPWVVSEFIMVDGSRISGTTLMLGDYELNQHGIYVPADINERDPETLTAFEANYTSAHREEVNAHLQSLRQCHAMFDPANRKTARSLTAEPLDGTLKPLNGLADRGKTGTKAKVGGATNVAWSIAAMERPRDPGEHTFVIVVSIGTDSLDTFIGRKASGGNTAGPVARDVLQMVQQRSRSGHLKND